MFPAQPGTLQAIAELKRHWEAIGHLRTYTDTDTNSNAIDERAGLLCHAALKTAKVIVVYTVVGKMLWSVAHSWTLAVREIVTYVVDSVCPLHYSVRGTRTE